MNKTTDSYKRLQAVIKDVNGDNRGICSCSQCVNKDWKNLLNTPRFETAVCDAGAWLE